jgi:hypothetical protein
MRKLNLGHSAQQNVAGDHTAGHVGPAGWVPLADQALCDALQQEIALARSTALRYPTATDAMAAGWRKVAPYTPGLGTHYMNFQLLDDHFAIDEPEMILYDGDGPEARVVGLSYRITHQSDSQPTQGFTGDNDHYHRHIGLCIKDLQVIANANTSAEECAARGGQKAGAASAAGWMSHAWVIPGCESPWGLFSAANPVLDRRLAEQSGANAGACGASKARVRYDAVTD